MFVCFVMSSTPSVIVDGWNGMDGSMDGWNLEESIASLRVKSEITCLRCKEKERV